MCLSIVYDEDQNLLCENVMMVDQKEPGKLDFYNILGVRTTVFGSIEKINLIRTGRRGCFFLFYTMRQDSQSCSSGNLLWSYSMPFLS